MINGLNYTTIDFATYDTSMSIGVVDTSVYNPDVPVSNPLICVTLPGFTQSSAVSKTFYPLQVNVVDGSYFGSNVCLPDGVYTFTVSVDPNDKVYATKTHLRTINIRKKLKDISLEKLDNGYDLCGIFDLYNYLTVAEQIVCEDPDKANTLLEYVNAFVDSSSCNNC